MALVQYLDRAENHAGSSQVLKMGITFCVIWDLLEKVIDRTGKSHVPVHTIGLRCHQITLYKLPTLEM